MLFLVIVPLIWIPLSLSAQGPDDFQVLPTELALHTLHAVDPERARRYEAPVWVIDRRRQAMVMLRSIETVEDAAADRYGMRVLECTDAMKVEAKERGSSVGALRAALATEGPDSDAMFAVLWKRSVQDLQNGSGGLCYTQLYPMDYPDCRRAAVGHPLCLELWEFRNFFYLYSVAADAGLVGRSRTVRAAPDEAQRRVWSWAPQEPLATKWKMYAVGTQNISNSCANAAANVRSRKTPTVLWALAVVDRILEVTTDGDAAPTDSRLLRRSRTVLNIGAADGGGTDPLAPLLPLNYSGIWAEADSKHLEDLRQNLGDDPRRSILHTRIIPEMAATVLEVGQFQKLIKTASLDVLKVDIDSYDCDIAKAFLQPSLMLTPKLVWIEVNWSIPPPLRYARHYDGHQREDDIKTARVPFHGCSLSYIVHMMHDLGYSLLTVDSFDAVFLHDGLGKHLRRSKERGSYTSAVRFAADDADSIMRRCEANPPLDEFQVFHSREHLTVFAPNDWIREWFYSLPAHEALAAVWRNLTAWGRQFDRADVPFTLDL